MLPMTRYTCTAEGPNQGRTCLAGQMPNPATPITALLVNVYPFGHGDYLVQWEDDLSFYSFTPTLFAANFQPIIL